MSLSSVVIMDRVAKQFGNQEAVSDVSLTVEHGQAVALLGPNGAGKSTTIAMMLGLIEPTRGTVRLFDGPPNRAAAHENIGVVLQNVSVPDRLRVWECLNLVRGFFARPLTLEELLALSGLEGDRNTMAHLLSGGKTRRLQFALAMAGNPDLLFLDEPTASMDVASKRQFWDALRRFVREGKTLLLTTHDLKEADMMTDRVVVMHRGRIIQDAPPERIKMEFGDRQVRFVTDDPALAGALSGWEGISEVAASGREVTVTTRDSDAVLRRLIVEHWDVRDIRVGGGGLEEAFLRLTAEEGSDS